jgi:hypothetical protein
VPEKLPYASQDEQTGEVTLDTALADLYGHSVSYQSATAQVVWGED